MHNDNNSTLFNSQVPSLEQFLFCPRCGSPHFVANDWKSRRCEDCGFTYYLNPSAAMAAFIVNDNGEVLVISRKIEPAKGRLDLPGGFCDIGESVEQGVAREVKEETCLEVTAMQFLFSLPNRYLYSGFIVPTADMFFLCKAGDASLLHAGDDAESARWMRPEDMRPSDFAFESTRKAVEKFIENASEYLKK